MNGQKKVELQLDVQQQHQQQQQLRSSSQQKVGRNNSHNNKIQSKLLPQQPIKEGYEFSSTLNHSSSRPTQQDTSKELFEPNNHPIVEIFTTNTSTNPNHPHNPPLASGTTQSSLDRSSDCDCDIPRFIEVLVPGSYPCSIQDSKRGCCTNPPLSSCTTISWDSVLTSNCTYKSPPTQHPLPATIEQCRDTKEAIPVAVAAESALIAEGVYSYSKDIRTGIHKAKEHPFKRSTPNRTSPAPTPNKFNSKTPSLSNSLKSENHPAITLPELQYSGSFTSSSTTTNSSTSFCLLNIEQDYTEEQRLLRIAIASKKDNSNIAHNNNNKSFTSKTKRCESTYNQIHSSPVRNTSHCESETNQLKFGFSKSYSLPSSSLPSSSSSSSSLLKMKQSNRSHSNSSNTGAAASAAAGKPLTAHSNLGDLLNARKVQMAKKQQEQQQQQQQQNDASHHRRTTTTVATTNITRPVSMIYRSKSKSTGMITHQSSRRIKSDPTVDPTSGTVFMNNDDKNNTSTTSMNHYNNRMIQRPSRIQISNSIGAAPTENNVSKVDNAAIHEESMNPFEDPSLIGDLQNNQHGGSSISHNFMNTAIQLNLNTTGATPAHHPLQVTKSFSPSHQRTQFDPLEFSTFSTTNVSSSSQQRNQSQAQNQNQPPSPKIDTAQLSEIAAALSSLKPQQPQQPPHSDNTNPDSSSTEHHQVTLGQVPKESTGTSKSHRRFLSLRGPKSLNVDDMKHVTDAMQITAVGSNASSANGGGGMMIGGSESFGYGITDSFDTVNSTNTNSNNHNNSSNNGATGTGGGSSGGKEKKHRRAASLGIFKRNSYDTDGGDGANDNISSSSRPTAPVKGFLRGRNSNKSSPNPRNDPDQIIGRSSGSRSPSKRRFRLGGGRHSRNNSKETVPVQSDPQQHQQQPPQPQSQIHNLAINEISPDLTRNRKTITQRQQSQPLETIESNDSSKNNQSADETNHATNTNVEITIRSSEQDPSPHQVSIPHLSDVILQAKLCRLMERYREIDQNFDFGILKNVSREQMEYFINVRQQQVGGNAPPPAKAVGQPSFTPMISMLPNLVEAHKPIVDSIVTAASDLVLCGFYYELNQADNTITHDTTKERSPGDRTEVAVFASDVLRQFIVVYQGSTENQTKPVRKNRLAGKFKKATKNFGDDESLTVYPPFEQGYTQSGLEERVFKKLDELAEQHPFFDVIVTGHSYGAMLALLGSMRYARLRPSLMVSCIGFGCPKVGALDFRHFVNSLPNLKVIRLENGFDPWVYAPENPSYTHAGHTISIVPLSQANKERSQANKERKGNSSNSNNVKGGPKDVGMDDLDVKAYKFGNDRPGSAPNGKFMGKKGNRLEKQIDHDISSYLGALGLIANKDINSWPRYFVGEEGSGVRGLNREKRLVC